MKVNYEIQLSSFDPELYPVSVNMPIVKAAGLRVS
jgi:hypothetical protein